MICTVRFLHGRELGWYADNLLELERALGRQGAFLHALKEGESYDRMAIIEGVGKLVQSKVLADTTRKYKLGEKLNAFLDMIRHLVQRAVAMLKLGKAINKVLADKEASAKLDKEFVGMVDRLVEKFLRELQLEEGLAAMQRVLEQRVPSTPVLDKAEKNHGKKVRAAARKKAEVQARVDADVVEGEAAVEGSMSADTASRYHVVDDSVELEKRLDDVVDVVEISFVEEEGKNWLKEAKQYFSLIAGRVFSLENTEGFTLKMPDHRAGRDTAVKGIRKKHQFKAEVIKKFEELFKKVVLLDRQIPAHKDKETPSRKKRVAAAKVFYKFGWPVRINGTEKMFWFGADAYDATNEKNVVFYEFGLQGMNEKGDSAVRTVLPDEEVEQGTESPLSAITLGDYLANVKLNPNQERVLPEVVSVDTETKEDSSLSVAEAEAAVDGDMSASVDAYGFASDMCGLISEGAVTLHNAQHGDILYEAGNPDSFGAYHVIERRMQQGFSEDEAARIAVLVGWAAMKGTPNRHFKNRKELDRNNVRAVVAIDPNGDEVITGFAILNNKYRKKDKGAGASAGAHSSQTSYASDGLNSVQQKVAALEQSIEWFEDIVKKNPNDFELVIEAYVESLQIKHKAQLDGTFMKAPNGEPTRLTEQQWLQVRTGAFKGWFGDWEKVARFNSAVQQLRSMNDVASITGTEFAPDGRKLTDKVTEFWNKEYGGVAKNPILGDVTLDTRSVKASIAHGVGRLKSAAFAVVHDVIEQGVLVEIAPDWKGRGEDSYVIAAPVQIGNASYVCEVVVMKGETRTGFYLHEVQIKEKLLDVFKTGVVTGTSGASKSILLDVWQRVKQIEENCSKIVDENGEPLVVTHATNAGPFTVFRKGERAGLSGKGIYFSPDGVGIWGKNIMHCFLNVRNPLTKVNAPREVNNGGMSAVIPDVFERFPQFNGVMLRRDEITVRDPEQIKSATDNRGTFDGGNPDITFSVIGPKAKTWDKYKERAFTGRDDGMPRAEIDASGAKLKSYSHSQDPTVVIPRFKALIEFIRSHIRNHGRMQAVTDDWTGKPPSIDSYDEVLFIRRVLEKIGMKFKNLGELVDSGVLEAVLSPTNAKVGAFLKKAEWKPEGMSGYNKLEDVLEYPELYAAYPQLRQVPVLWQKEPEYRGLTCVSGTSGDVWVNMNEGLAPERMISTLLHEVQHVIQFIEGYAAGTFDFGALRGWMSDNGYLEQALTMENREIYARLAGEIESRNVQMRQNWTMDERLAKPFNDTLEYPGEAITVTAQNLGYPDARFIGDAPVSFSVALQRKHELTLNHEQTTQTEAIKHLEELEGQPLVNTQSGLVAFVNKPQRKELTDLSKSWKSANNGFSLGAHYAAVGRIERLFAHAVPCGEYKDKKNGDKQVLIHRFACPLMIGGEKAVAWLTAKQTTNVEGSERLYNLELVDIEKLAGNLENLASHRLQDDLPAASKDIVAEVEEAFKTYFEDVPESDSSSSIINLDEESVAREVVDAGQGFRANLAYGEAIMREMRGAMQRLRRLGSKTRTDREDAVAAMGTMVQMVKAAVAGLPKGYRFSVHPYLNRIEALAELAATGDIDLTSDIASKDILQLENEEGVDLKKPYDEMVKEYGNVKLAEALERIMHRVSEQLRKHAKDRAVEKITELVERLAPKKDPKTGKLKGGKMSADSYRNLATVDEAMKMNAEQLEAKLAALRADLAKPGISEALRAQLEDEMTLYDQYGDLASMTPEDAVAAYEALRVRIYFHRFEWDDKQARVRGARRAVVRRVVDGVGSVSENEYNAKKRRVKPTKRLKNLGDILSGMPAALAGLRGYLPLRQMADELALRTNAAGEAIKAWEAERWEALEVLSQETMGKSWRECMDFMHKVQPSGVSFDRPKFRTVNVKTEELRELLEMTKEERKAEMKRRREAGGLEAERALSERDVQELQKKLEAMEEEGRVLSRVETRYMVEIQHEENLQLSRGEALYAILMFEQPTYTERLIMQGYTFEVIEGLREYVGDGMLQFGYGLRELFAKQGDRIAAVYENAFGVPFPREENYFAARWVVNGTKEKPAEQLLAGMAGTPGAANGWMKQRVNHNLELDMTKDALQVFLQATSLTDTWMATQDIVADFKAWTRDADFERALTALLGQESYDNLKDWIRILEQGGVQDCLNMGVSQDVINGLYGSGAVAILGLRIQTLLKQTPAIFNGLLGAHDISAAEWFATMSRMKNGDAPMTYERMVNSTLMKMRQQGKAGNMAGQAARSGDTASSAAEGLLMASMLPMEWVDARCTAIGLVPAWNVYYQRAVDQGASHEEAERAAWEQTALVANLSSQPIGWLNKIKIAQSRNPIVKSAFYMLSENMAKFALSRALWRGGKKKAAIRAWLVYGAANAAISAMLDALQGDPEEFEKGKWWEYAFSALYGPASGIPGVGEALEAAVNALLNLTGEVADIDWMKKVKTRASAGRALVDIQGSAKALGRIWGYMTDNDEHSLAEYTRVAGTVSRTLAIVTGWMGNMVGYWSTAVAVLMNPVDFGARVWRNMKHYAEE